VEVIGSEKVKGVDCYVLQVIPEIQRLWQTVGAEGYFRLPNAHTIPEELLQDVFDEFTVKQWIAKDTYFLMKTEMDISMESTPELMDYLGEEGETSLEMTINFLAYNYNEPVTIELRPEAKEAIGM